jgi:hypothetical protein
VYKCLRFPVSNNCPIELIKTLYYGAPIPVTCQVGWCSVLAQRYSRGNVFKGFARLALTTAAIGMPRRKELEEIGDSGCSRPDHVTVQPLGRAPYLGRSRLCIATSKHSFSSCVKRPKNPRKFHASPRLATNLPKKKPRSPANLQKTLKNSHYSVVLTFRS